MHGFDKRQDMSILFFGLLDSIQGSKIDFSKKPTTFPKQDRERISP